MAKWTYLATFQSCYLSFFLVLLFFSPLFAAELRKEIDRPGVVVVKSQQVIPHDYFAYGRSVEISGTIDGDLYVCGSQVFIDGIVRGDVLVLGGSVEITGLVTQNVRLVAAQVTVSGAVGGSLSGLAATVELTPSASIGKNVVLLVGNADLSGKVHSNARMYASNLRISREVGGNVTAYVGQMRVTSKALVGGNIEYWSHHRAIIDQEAGVKGKILHHPSFFYYLMHGKIFKGLRIGSKLAALCMNFLYTLGMALLLFRYFPIRLEDSIKVLNQRPLQAFLTGALLLFLLPIACLMLLITIVGIPFALTLLAINVISFYTAKIFSIFWFSKSLFCRFDYKRHKKLYFSATLFLYSLLTLIPYLGMILSVVALIFGLGGVILSRHQKSA